MGVSAVARSSKAPGSPSWSFEAGLGSLLFLKLGQFICVQLTPFIYLFFILFTVSVSFFLSFSSRGYVFACIADGGKGVSGGGGKGKIRKQASN